METLETNDEVTLDLREIVAVLLKKLWMILLVGVLFAAGAFSVSKYLITPMYQSTTKIYVMNKQDSSTAFTYSDLQTGSQLTQDYMTLVKSRPVVERVIEELGLDEDYNSLVGMISVGNPSNTRILNITVRYPDPYLAMNIADTLRDAAALHISSVMNIEKLNVAEQAYLPDGPSSPNMISNTLIGGILGCFLSIAVILIIYITDDTIKTSEDIERHLGISVLAIIPIQKGLKHNSDNNRQIEKHHKKAQSKKADKAS